jgi:hypothetical protein
VFAWMFSVLIVDVFVLQGGTPTFVPAFYRAAFFKDLAVATG